MNLPPDSVASRADLVAYAYQLSSKAKADNCENQTTHRYLESFSAWTNDMDGFFLNREQRIDEVPVWSLIAHMLTAALYYE